MVSTITLDGGFSFEVLDTSGSGTVGDNTADWHYKVKLTFNHWTYSNSSNGNSFGIDGSMTLLYSYDKSADADTAKLSGGPITFTTNGDSTKLSNLDVTYTAPSAGGYTLDMNYDADFNTSKFTGTVTVTTDAANPLHDSTDADNFPDTGVVTVMDNSGNKAVIDAAGGCGSDEFQLTYTAAGGGVMSNCKPWQ